MNKTQNAVQDYSTFPENHSTKMIQILRPNQGKRMHCLR